MYLRKFFFDSYKKEKKTQFLISIIILNLFGKSNPDQYTVLLHYKKYRIIIISPHQAKSNSSILFKFTNTQRNKHTQNTTNSYKTK